MEKVAQRRSGGGGVILAVPNEKKNFDEDFLNGQKGMIRESPIPHPKDSLSWKKTHLKALPAKDRCDKRTAHDKQNVS